jgi:aminoglycoside phosphotransferase (APT) family kinase protein
MPNALHNTDKQDVIDKAGQVRKAEELNLTALIPWLESNIPSLKGRPKVSQYSGGASNWTYCLSYPQEDGEVRDVILCRAPAGTKAKGAHDMGREYRLQAALKPVYPNVPEMLGYCDDGSVLGTDFYVMEKLNGLIPRMNMPKGLMLKQHSIRELCLNALDSLIKLHKVDYKTAGLDYLAKGEGYTQRQIEGWSARYIKAKTWNVPSAKYVTNWLK